jgi:hypothetical protein
LIADGLAGIAEWDAVMATMTLPRLALIGAAFAEAPPPRRSLAAWLGIGRRKPPGTFEDLVRALAPDREGMVLR